jgi:hypothetical protein
MHVKTCADAILVKTKTTIPRVKLYLKDHLYIFRNIIL